MRTAMERSNSSYKERGSEASMADNWESKMPIQMELDLLKWIKCIQGQVPV